jgi:nitroimidazol reductase NimA-like FMN-containing flavoprotein (pyridoxamine 5'-phosphate oxidase superfamily)
MVELSRQDCLQLLAAQSFGRLAVNLGEGAPVIRPVNYHFEQSLQSVVFRTAPGSKFHALLRAAHAAFEIDGIDAASRTGWSVIVIGVTDEVTHPLDIRRLERLGLEPWAPGPKPHWMHIRAWVVSGRRIVLPADTVPGRYPG